MRRTAWACAALMLVAVGCGGGQKTQPPPEPAPVATPPAPPDAAPVAWKADRDKCGQVIDKMLDVTMNDPKTTDAQKKQIEQMKPQMKSDDVINKCISQLTEEQYNCVMAAQDTEAMGKCQ